MKEILSWKTILSVLASTAITGTMLAGFGLATNKMPTHWPLTISRAPPPLQIYVVGEGQEGYECDWISSDLAVRMVRCPHIVVTATRPKPNAVVAGTTSRTHDVGGTVQQDSNFHSIPDVPR